MIIASTGLWHEKEYFIILLITEKEKIKRKSKVKKKKKKKKNDKSGTGLVVDKTYRLNSKCRCNQWTTRTRFHSGMVVMNTAAACLTTWDIKHMY